jgi:PAS domain S-box-containing protein
MASDPKDVTSLRARAEEALARSPRVHADPQDLAQTVHELEVSQVELEMQNVELRASQRYLEEARERYRLLFEVAPIAYVTLDAEGAIQAANTMASGLLRVARPQLIGRPLSAFVDPGDAIKFETFRREVLSRSVHRRSRLRFRDPILAETPTFRVDAVADLPTTTPRLTRVALTDISALVEMQAALAASDAQTSAILETAADAIISFDDQGRVIAFNSAAERLLGYKAAVVMGKGVSYHSRSDLAPLPGRRREMVVVDRAGNDVPVECSVAEVEVGGRMVRTESMRDLRERKAADRAREQLSAELRYLNERLIMAHDEERKRLARELHDEAGQALTALAIGLEQLKGTRELQQAHARASELQRVLAEVTTGMGRLARGLHPQALDDLGLVAAIEQHVREYPTATELACDFQHVGLAGVSLPSRIERAVFRFVQEALTNVVRHAAAKTVHIVIHRRGKTLRAIVEDDGCGFDVNKVAVGLGLTAMRDRASHIGGELDIASSPGAGTTLTLVVPLEP